MKILIEILGVLHCLGSVWGQGLEFYVSNDSGSDSWDGTSETNVDGSDVGPWRTLSHAIHQVRQIRPDPPTASDKVTISMLPGRYFLSTPLDMDERDSYITIRALYEEETSISGGVVLDGDWSEEEGGVRTTTFEGSCGEAFVGSLRLVPARSPNTNKAIDYNMNIAHPSYHTIKDLLVETADCTRNATGNQDDCPDENRLGFVYKDEFDPNWEHLQQTKILVFHSWVAEYAKVQNLTEENGVSKVFFEKELQKAPIGTYIASGWRYIIYNNKAILDIPGEYVCVDNGDDTSTFSYIHPDMPELEEISVVMSQLTQTVVLNQVNNVRLQGIKFEHSSSNGVDGYPQGDEAALRIVSSQHVVVEDCQFSSTGMVGMYVVDSSNVHVTKSVFTDIGGHGLMVHYDDFDMVGLTYDVTVDNNLFDGCGISSFWQCHCIQMGGESNMTVRSNEVTNVPNSAIAIRGLMHGADYWEDNGVTDPTRDDYIFHVEYNKIYNYGLGILTDFGGVMLSESCLTGEIIHHIINMKPIHNRPQRKWPLDGLLPTRLGT